MSISLPENHEIRYESIVEISKKLIRFSYWDRFDISDLQMWLNNFKTDEERYIASGILLSLMYRNDKSMKTFSANIMQIKLPSILRELNIYDVVSLQKWEGDLKKGVTALPVRFSTIEDFGDRPGKSGSAVYRKVQSEFFHKRLGIKCRDIDQVLKNNCHIKSLVLFDDILGTGSQFEDFIKEHKLNDKDIDIIYFPFAAVSDSVRAVVGKYSNIYIIPVELLSDKESLFSSDSIAFDGLNVEDVKSFYLKMCNDREIKCGDKLGYGEQALTYFFKDSVPNNNIAAIWYDSDQWTKLAGR